MIGIYCIENLINGKRYIGQSMNVEHRIMVHRAYLRHGKHFNAHLQKAWEIHGEENFEFLIVKTCTEEELDALEIGYISVFKTTDKRYGYNMDSGGSLEKRRSPETITKMSAKLRGRKGHVVSEETKRKISEANRGQKRVVTKKQTPEHRRKITETRRSFGFWHLDKEEISKRISNAQRKYYETHESPLKGIPKSEEHRRKISEFQKGRKRSDEFRKKTSEGHKKYWAEKKARERALSEQESSLGRNDRTGD